MLNSKSDKTYVISEEMKCDWMIEVILVNVKLRVLGLFLSVL